MADNIYIILDMCVTPAVQICVCIHVINIYVSIIGNTNVLLLL